MNNVAALPQNRAFYLYLLKLTNTTTGQVYFKLGKADDIIKRYKDWKKDLMKVLSFYDKMISSNGWKIELVWSKHCWYVDGVYKYYMTSNTNKLTGNDSDDIFRHILVEHFKVSVYKINIYNSFLTDEGVDFKTNDIQAIKEILENAYNKWLDIIKERNVSACDYFVRLDLREIKKNQKIKKEFSDIRYGYQTKAVNWIYDKLSSGNNEDFLAIIPCGAGKTSISMDACVRISVENEYKPILLLAGLKSVFNAFDGDSEKFTYSGKEVLCYDLTHFHKSIGETNAKLGKITLVYTTCQAGIKRGGDENEVDMDSKLSERLFKVLDDGVQFSAIITDEAHKIVFGGKMMNLYPEIRAYHSNPLNIIHMSGTGFNTTRKMDFRNKIYNISEKEIRKAQGKKAVNRHMIVCKNTGFIPYFEEHIAEGWDQILNGNIKVDMFNDVDSINCISTIKSGIEKPVIGAYLSSVDVVRRSFDYLASTYSYDDVLVISANGCNIGNDGKGYGDVFIRNGKNNTVVKIKNSYNEVISEVNKFANQGKMVILLNVDKFVESWTIKEMNVQLILRNVGSPDTFGQAIARGTRTYTEQIGDITNVIKKDAYVFLYGDTFTKMVYELFFDKYNYRKLYNRHKNMDVAWNKAMEDLFGDGNTIYMDGNVYGYEENNLTDLRDVILRDSVRCNRSADSLISTMKRTFSDCFSKLYKMNISIWKMVKTYPATKKVNTVDGEGNHNDGQGSGSGRGSTNGLKNMSEEELFAKIKTFMYTLLTVRIAKHGFVTLDGGAFDYDTLVREAAEEPIDGENNYYLDFDKQFSGLFGSEITHFKMAIMDWMEGQYLSCMNYQKNVVSLYQKTDCMNKETVFNNILNVIRKNQINLMDVGAFKTGVVPDQIIKTQMSFLPDEVTNVVCVSDYGEYVSYLKHKYGGSCNVYCLPSTLYGYNMCIQALSVYETNPEDFVIFNKEKYLSLKKDKYFEDIMKDEGMLFDCAIGNPPYDRRLHLKIINNVLEYLNDGGVGVFIHPAGWLYNPAKYNLTKNFKIDRYFSQKDCADIFGVVVQSGLVLSIFSDTFDMCEYNELYPKYSERLDAEEIDFLKHIKEKIISKTGYDIWANHINEQDPNSCERCVTVAQIVGGSGGRSMKLNHKKICTYVLENGVVVKGDVHIGDRFSKFLKSSNGESYSIIVEHPDEIYEYSKTGYTFALQDVLFRYDQHPMYSKYLWMETWTDDEYYDYFGLIDDRVEIERIIDKITKSEVKMKVKNEEDD